jgi:hypothetical protein
MRLHCCDTSRYLLVLLITTCGACASANAGNAPINASLDTANRSVRLEPIGISIKLPDDMAVNNFNVRPDFMEIVALLRPSGFLPLEIYFQPPACSEWIASSAKNLKKKTQKPGTKLFDERWSQTWLASDDWKYFCLDRPGGGSVRIDTSAPLEKFPRQPFYQFTANVADAFQVPAGGAAAAPAMTPAAATDVSGVTPKFADGMAALCNSGNQLQCQALSQYRSLHQSCVDGGWGQCNAAGAMCEQDKDFQCAASYYQRSCDLGNSDACEKAKKNARKAK